MEIKKIEFKASMFIVVSVELEFGNVKTELQQIFDDLEDAKKYKEEQEDETMQVFIYQLII